MNGVSPETIYLNNGPDGEVIADFSAKASDALNDAYMYGFALRQTTDGLGIARYNPTPNRAVFLGDVDTVLDRLPRFSWAIPRIAHSSGYEQPEYSKANAERCQVIVDVVLKDLVQVLPEIARDREFIDVCEQVILPFSKICIPEGEELRIVRNVQPLWRMTPEERVQFESSVADGAEHYLQVLGGR